MGEADQATTIGIIDRLARLEGMLVGLQNSIGQSQQQWASSQRKVELLEQRLVQLEANQVTRGDMKELSAKVDALINKNAQTAGGTGVLSWAVRNGAQWVAVLLSLFAISEVASNRGSSVVPPPGHERRP